MAYFHEHGVDQAGIGESLRLSTKRCGKARDGGETPTDSKLQDVDRSLVFPTTEPNQGEPAPTSPQHQVHKTEQEMVVRVHDAGQQDAGTRPTRSPKEDDHEDIPVASKIEIEERLSELTIFLQGYSQTDDPQWTVLQLMTMIMDELGERSNLKPRLFDGKHFDDGLSPFFARDLCWNAHYSDIGSSDDSSLVPWPSCDVLANNSPGHAYVGPGRLPLPRENRLADGLDPNQAVYNDDATLSTIFRRIQLDRLYLDRSLHLIQRRRFQDGFTGADIAELPGATQTLVQTILDYQHPEMETSVPETEPTKNDSEQSEESEEDIVDQSPTPASNRRLRPRPC